MMKFSNKTTCVGIATLFVLSLLVAGQAMAQTCVAPPAGMVAWWPGDGNANDISGFNNHGTLVNGTTFAAGQVGQAFSFDGVNDHVLITNASTLNPTGAITVDAWVNFTSTNWQDIVSKDGEGFDRQYLLNVNVVPGSFRAHVGVPTFTYFDGSIPVALGTWYHVAMTYDGTALRLYVNGALDYSQPVSGAIITTPQPVRIGGGAPSPYVPFYFQGLIDEAEIYNRALSQADIQAIYNAGSVGKCKTIQVAIDIKPGNDPNTINLGSAGVVPVAILSTATFDATTVDPTTVTLAGATVAVKGKGTLMYSFQDVNLDGFTDLVVHVSTQALELSDTDTAAILTGTTSVGHTITGTDTIRVVP